MVILLLWCTDVSVEVNVVQMHVRVTLRRLAAGTHDGRLRNYENNDAEGYHPLLFCTLMVITALSLPVECNN